MANIATGEFAAAVSTRRGSGPHRQWWYDHCPAGQHIRRCRELTDRPFGVNIMLMNPEAAAMAELVARERSPWSLPGQGNPAPYMEMWKRRAAW